MAPAHYCTASDAVNDSSVIIACKAAPGALLGGGDCGISFTERSQHLDGQLLYAPITLGSFLTTFRRDLRGCQPCCLPRCLLAHNRFPHRQRLAVRTAFRLAERSSPETRRE
jgi:hypothetical protein